MLFQKALEMIKKVIMSAIKYKAFSYNYASERLKKDREVVTFAIENGIEFNLIEPMFQNDKEVGISAIKNNLYNFWNISDKLKTDKEIIITAVNVGLNVRYIPFKLTKIAMLPVKLIKYATKNLQNFAEIQKDFKMFSHTSKKITKFYAQNKIFKNGSNFGRHRRSSL